MKLRVRIALPGGETRIVTVKGPEHTLVNKARIQATRLGGWILRYIPKGGL